MHAELDALKLYHQIRISYGLYVLGGRSHKQKKPIFVRGRIADESNLTPDENHLSYPPPELCTKHGRANIPGYPVFYAGQSPAVIASEIGLHNGDWFHMAIFYTPIPVDFRYVMLLHDNLDKANSWKMVLQEFHDHVRERNDLPESTEHVLQRLNAAALLFRNNTYAITSSISHYWLYKKQVDAILYPSVKNDLYCNFALRPGFVDDHFEPYCVHACRWMGDRVQLHYTGTSNNDDHIEWHATTPDQRLEFESVYSHLTD